MYRYGAVPVSLLVVSIVAVFSCFGGSRVALARPLGEAFVLGEEIQEYWSEGYHITDVAYGDGLWAVVMTEGANYGRQAWVYSVEFPDDFIAEKWDEGLDLTVLAYGDGAWVAVMTGGLGWQQSYMRGSFQEISDHMDKYPDYMISEVAYGNGEWVGVMSLGKFDNAQYWYLSPEWPVDGVLEKWDEGYSITDVTYGEAEWFVVMTYDAGYLEDRVRRRTEWPADDIHQDYDEVPDGSVVTLDYGDGLWVYTFAVTDWSGGQAVAPAFAPERPEPTAAWAPTVTAAETVTPVSTSTPTPTAGLSSPTMARVEEIRAAAPDAAYDFETDSGGWELLYDDDYATYLRDGAYHVALDATDVVAWGYGEDVAGDFYAEVDVTNLAGTEETEAGIAFRCAEPDSCYFFFVHPGAAYSLQALIGEEWAYLVDGTASDVVETGAGATNRLGILAEGDQLSLLVNDVMLAEIADDSISGARFGLAASSYEEAGVEFGFDNFALWTLDEAAAATAAPIATPSPAATPEPGGESDAQARADVMRRVDAIRAAEPVYGNSFAADERWDVESTADIVRYYADDALHMRVIPESTTEWTLLEQEPADFFLEFDVAFAEGADNAGAGLIFRMADDANYYRFAISSLNSFSLLKRLDGEWIYLTEWTAADNVQTADEAANRLGVLADGNTIALFANDALLTVVEDDSLARGELALGVLAYDAGNVEAQFDNVAIWDVGGHTPAQRAQPASSLPLPAAKESTGADDSGEASTD